MASRSRLARRRLFRLSLAILSLSLGCVPLPGSAMGLPKPRPNLTLTIGVEGFVRCAMCRHAAGGDADAKPKSQLEESPLPNATALLRCRRGGGSWAVPVRAATDERGYFLIQTGRQVGAFTSKDCEVYVTQPPAWARPCGGGGQRRMGAPPLKFHGFVTLPGDALQALYSVGSFTFGPQQPGDC